MTRLVLVLCVVIGGCQVDLDALRDRATSPRDAAGPHREAGAAVTSHDEKKSAAGAVTTSVVAHEAATTDAGSDASLRRDAAPMPPGDAGGSDADAGPSCQVGWADCDNDRSNGCETATTTLTDCGHCDVSCGAERGTASCESGQCEVVSCEAGYADCDDDAANGCEAHLDEDAQHCGSCDHACAPAATCTAGRCGYYTNACAADQAVRGVTAEGEIVCGNLAEAATSTIERDCRIYAGWRDSCDGCNTPPSKWGFSSQSRCENGQGEANTCTQSGGVRWFGLNTNGDVNADDKFYYGFHCPSLINVGDPAPASRLCPEGQFVHGMTRDGRLECTGITEAALRYAREQCVLYVAHQGPCTCTLSGVPNIEVPCACSSFVDGNAGVVGDSRCASLAGGDNTCATYTLGVEDVRMFGLSMSGDVAGFHGFYMGLRCGTSPSSSTTSTICPRGWVANGLNVDGTVQCKPASAAFDDAIRERCFAHLGWRDECDGCTGAPSGYGGAGTEPCEASGSGSSCTTVSFDGLDLRMLRVGTAGDVNGDDKLYTGLSCD